MAWPGVVISPRWFSAHTSRSTVGLLPPARYFLVTVPRSHWVSPTKLNFRNSQSSFHSQASSPIQSVHRWISHVSRILP